MAGVRDDLRFVAIKPKVHIAIVVRLPVNGLGWWRRKLIEGKTQVIGKTLRQIRANLAQLLTLSADRQGERDWAAAAAHVERQLR